VHDETVLDELARRYHWWQTPAQARADQVRFLCQLMQFGTYEDVRIARRILGDEAFRIALAAAPAGVLDDRSWNFWHLVLFGRPAPAQPSRPLPP
jgi:hypothetical protein